MSIKTDPPNEAWRSPVTDNPEKKVDGRTKAGRAAKASHQIARDAEVQSRAERQEKAVETDRQIMAAVGNRNQEQIDRRNAIADALDATPDRKEMQEVGENLVVDESDQAEKDAKRAEEEAEAERQRLEAEANERAAKEEQEAGVVHAEPRKFKLRVNGKDVEFTEAEVLERASKVSSADEYLQSAAKAVELSQALGLSKDGSAGGEEDSIEDTLTSALQGDSEAIKKVAQRLKAPPVKDVLSAVDDRLSFRSAVDWFRGEYKDVVEDPMLYRLVVDEDSRIAKAEPLTPYRDRLKRAGDRVRDWKQTITGKPPTNPKLERKASVAVVPTAGGRQVVRDEEEGEEPVETVIDKMARDRGQGGAVRRN